MTVTRVAAYDCGTNSLRLLVADVDHATGTLVDVERRMEIVRLGEGVDRTGRIAPDAMRRTLDVTASYAVLCRELGVTRSRFVATSASRDAANRDEFVAGVRARVGVTPEVIHGHQEAELSFTGATAGLDRSHPSPLLVVDLGGGSTEFALGEHGSVTAAVSVDVGCVRMAERHDLADPPAPERLAAATADVDAAIDRAAAAVPLDRAGTLVGLAGTVTTVTAHALRLTCYDSARIHGARLPIGEVRASCEALIAADRATRAAMPFLHAGRADVIGAGALVWRRIVERVAEAAGIVEVVASEHDILDGIAFGLAEP